jgi:DNA polymerase V
MEGEEFYGAAYKGSKQFSQQQVSTANATGFGAATDDYAERGIDLNEQLVRNKPATFFFRMKGDAMQDAGIFDGDTLIVDRSVKAGKRPGDCGYSEWRVTGAPLSQKFFLRFLNCRKQPV